MMPVIGPITFEPKLNKKHVKITCTPGLYKFQQYALYIYTSPYRIMLTSSNGKKVGSGTPWAGLEYRGGDQGEDWAVFESRFNKRCILPFLLDHYLLMPQWFSNPVLFPYLNVITIMFYDIKQSMEPYKRLIVLVMATAEPSSAITEAWAVPESSSTSKDGS